MCSGDFDSVFSLASSHDSDIILVELSSSKQLSEIERNSITYGLLSPEHEYYQGTIEQDPTAAEYIQELSIYDEEINDTFIVHISLPPDYDPEQKYPLLMMTDGIWRLGDHVDLRLLMTEGKMEPVIIVSVGYPNNYSVGTIRERDFLDQPDLFLQFLVENLLPVLNEKCSIDTEKTTLTGHSLLWNRGVIPSKLKCNPNFTQISPKATPVFWS